MRKTNGRESKGNKNNGGRRVGINKQMGGREKIRKMGKRARVIKQSKKESRYKQNKCEGEQR